MIRQWHKGTAGENTMHPKNVNPPPLVGTIGQSAKRSKTTLPVSSYTNYSSGIAAVVPSPLAVCEDTHCSSQCGGEPAVLSSREKLVQSKRMVIRSKKVHQNLEFANIKKSLGSIEMRATHKVIQEAERLMICGSHPNIVQVEKAKSLLEEQEKAIIGALNKLAEYSDQVGSHIDCDEQQESGHQLAAPHTFYEQYGSYYSNSLNVGHANGGSGTF